MGTRAPFIVPGGATFDTTTLVVDATNDRVGIGIASPTVALDVVGTVKATTFSGSGSSLSAVPASVLTGTVLPAGIVTSSLTSVGTLGSLAVTGTVTAGTFSGSGASLTSVPASALTGTTLPSSIVTSSLTSVGTLTALVVTGNLTVDTNTLFVDSANNRVGVGTVSPATALDVNGTVTATTFSGSGASLTSIAASALTGTSLPSGIVSSSLTSVGTLASLTVTGALTVDTTTLVVDATNNRVGIGIAAPLSPLHIYDTTNAIGIRFDTFTGGIALIGSTADNVSLRLVGGIPDQTNVGGNIYLYGNTHATYPSGVRIGADGTEIVRVDSAGTYMTGALTVDTTTLVVDSTNNRVGVLTATPSTALQVVGTVTATTFSGSGASLTTLNGSNISSGTVPVARLPFTRGKTTVTVAATTGAGSITHGLGSTPTAVFTTAARSQPGDNLGYIAEIAVSSVTSTVINIVAIQNDGTLITSTTVDVYWLAVA